MHKHASLSTYIEQLVAEGVHDWSLQDQEGVEVGYFSEITLTEAIAEARTLNSKTQEVLYLVPLCTRIAVAP